MMDLLSGKKNIIGFVSLCFISIPAFPATGHLYAGASLAASYAKIGNHFPQITYPSGVLILDDYPLSSRTVGTSLASLNGGYEFANTNGWPAIAVGLGFYTNPIDYDFNGQVIETVAGTDPETLYNYTYNVNNTRLMAEVQFTWQLARILPFITLGLGPSWSRTNGYTESPVTNLGFAAQPPFQSNTSLSVAYQVGFGISTAFNYVTPAPDFLQERISIGYRYVNLGQTAFGTRGSTYPYSLNTGSLTTNDFYISYTHLF